ncbi:MAG: 3-hydroxyacyl-CoA dehydrogenase NAD-binding protein [Bacteroidota bacterium]|nr:3-hydroxyacyl-CoA dehydrogenase NAD-binding protein [Bacteroidota bacterium]
MKLESIKTIGVAGAGAMGAGIAQVFAQAGFEVVLFDVNEQQLEKAKTEITKNLDQAVSKEKISKNDRDEALKKISFSSDLNSLKADLVIEAIVEKLEAKQDLFKKLAAFNSAETIFATNTSSIPITRIAKDIPNLKRVVGMHFFNPAHLMKLVEVITGAETSDQVAETLKDLSLKLGKTPVMCKDSPGFIVNRVARHYYVESLKMLEENVAPKESIDALMESAGFKMGPFKLMDFVGNDINFAVTSSLFESFHHDAKFRPSRVQQQKVDAGHLGRKTGKGFYNYN